MLNDILFRLNNIINLLILFDVKFVNIEQEKKNISKNFPLFSPPRVISVKCISSTLILFRIKPLKGSVDSNSLWLYLFFNLCDTCAPMPV